MKISVIIPAYNAENTICRAVDSALNQKNIEVEVIVINDCSLDFTQRVVSVRYSQNDQVKLLGTHSNSGPSTARNIGIEYARGDWISVLDADDWFAPDRLSGLLSSALEYELDFVADSYYLIRDQDTSPYSTRFTNFSIRGTVTQFTADSFVRHGLGSVKPLIKKAFLDRTGIRFLPSVWRGEDTLFYVTLLLNNARFGLLNKPLYIRSETPGSLSKSDKVKLLSDLLEVFEKLQLQAIKTGNRSNAILKALKYRATVVEDSLAAARWQSWLKNFDLKRLPNLQSLLNAVRHLLLRKKRYPTASVTYFDNLNNQTIKKN
jgi:succinoglycan biosynthesis protein ExoO